MSAEAFPEAREAFVMRLLARGYAVQTVRLAGVAVATCAATSTDTRLIELGSRAAYPEVSR